MQRYIRSPVERRKNRVRLSVKSQGKVRLSVFRSGHYIYAQIIDDSKSHTLACASSIEKEGRQALKSTSNCEAASWVGTRVAERALAVGIKEIVFDRGSYRYHGRVKALADAARAKGLLF